MDNAVERDTASREDRMDDVVRVLDRPCIIPVEAYTSEAYARAENEKLWPKVWQVACRVEEIPNVGDYVTYDILDESIIVVRSAPEKISAYYNVCQHRGRRLAEGCGQTKRFVCRFHGWSWNLKGENTFVLDPQDWGKCLTPENLHLKEVKVDTWGGWVWINMDPDSESLKDYLEPAVSMLNPFELEKMRYRWRKWLYFPSNWKVALEAFNESYHTDASHPQITRFGSVAYWCKAENHCAWHGAAGARDQHVRGGVAGLGAMWIRILGSPPRKFIAKWWPRSTRLPRRRMSAQPNGLWMSCLRERRLMWSVRTSWNRRRAMTPRAA